MRISITILFLIFGYTVSIAQTDFRKEIIGKWELAKVSRDFKGNTKKVAKHNSNIVKENKDPFMKKDVILSFRADKSIAFEIKEFLMVASYSLKNEQLTIGQNQYTILEITKDKLHLKINNDPSNMQYVYRRVVNK